MIIPHSSLKPEVLRAVVEEYVSREGTDYGIETSLEDKVSSVLAQLARGYACIVYDEQSESCDIVVVDSVRYKQIVGGDASGG